MLSVLNMLKVNYGIDLGNHCLVIHKRTGMNLMKFYGKFWNRQLHFQ